MLLPRFSLVIPAYNEERYLSRLLDSVDQAKRGYRGGEGSIEVIVADNASTDGTPAIALERGCRVASVEKRAIAAARNGGARIATGEILTFTDADMRIHPRTFDAIDDVLSDSRVTGGATGTTMERWSGYRNDLCDDAPARLADRHGHRCGVLPAEDFEESADTTSRGASPKMSRSCLRFGGSAAREARSWCAPRRPRRSRPLGSSTSTATGTTSRSCRGWLQSFWSIRARPRSSRRSTGIDRSAERRAACVVSGGNIDLDRFCSVVGDEPAWGYELSTRTPAAARRPRRRRAPGRSRHGRGCPRRTAAR